MTATSRRVLSACRAWRVESGLPDAPPRKRTWRCPNPRDAPILRFAASLSPHLIVSPSPHPLFLSFSLWRRDVGTRVSSLVSAPAPHVAPPRRFPRSRPRRLFLSSIHRHPPQRGRLPNVTSTPSTPAPPNLAASPSPRFSVSPPRRLLRSRPRRLFLSSTHRHPPQRGRLPNVTSTPSTPAPPNLSASPSHRLPVSLWRRDVGTGVSALVSASAPKMRRKTHGNRLSGAIASGTMGHPGRTPAHRTGCRRSARQSAPRPRAASALRSSAQIQRLVGEVPGHWRQRSG